ncbi:MAG: hypothetical protein IJZ20_05045 [Clostridia bacterium]|nr:hypothetical protein [Clostridia bacterium]
MKKLIAAIMASAMVLTPILPASAEFLAEEAAETEVTSSYKPAPASVNEPTTEKLEKIIKAVKPKLDVPEEYTEFDWNYNSATYYRQASWHLTWFKKDYSGEVSVSCDAKGNITSYNTYDNNYDRAIKLPEFSKLELAETAKAFLEKLAPEAASSMVLTNSYASSFYSKSFIYSFVRYENGVTVPDNTASVTVNYITGVPTAMHVGYNGYVSFDAEKEIDEESAKKLLTENQTMNLSYKLKNEYDEDGKLICRKAYLVYTPQVSYLSVDAKTGKVYTERNTWNILENGAGGSVNGMFGAMADSSLKSESAEAESEYRLSEEELAQLAVLEKLISREEAIKAVTENEYLYIDPQATAVDAQLRQISAYTPYGASNDRENDTYRWDITFSAPSVASDKKSYFSPYMRASVDAQTGAIISFNAEVTGEYYYKNT